MLPIPSLTAIKWAAIGLAAVGLLSAGAYGGYRWELGAYEKLVAADAAASTKAVQTALARQQAVDALNQATAVKAAQAQQRIVTQTVTLTREIPHYVTVQQDAAFCVSFGLVRVLYAAERGLDPASLSLPAGESDDACTALKLSDLAAAVTADYGASRQNSEQLDSLIASIQANEAAANH